MTTAPTRPAKGLNMYEALEKWSDPAAYAAMMEHVAFEKQVPNTPEGWKRHKAFRDQQEALYTKLKELLTDERLVGSGIREGQPRREIIEPDYWEVLDFDPDINYVGGNGVGFDNPEFFESAVVPRNVRQIPEWLSKLTDSAPAQSVFTHSSDYRHVSLQGKNYTLGQKQAEVIRQLHEAAKTDNPWRVGKQLLGMAEAAGTKLRDSFNSKTFNELIVSDQRGNYRLNL